MRKQAPLKYFWIKVYLLPHIIFCLFLQNLLQPEAAAF